MNMGAGRFNELELLRALALRESTPGTLIDVGAHIGSFSVAFAELGWQVLAIEPAPAIFEELKQNTASLPMVECIWAAVTDDDAETVDFYLSDEHWGIHSLRAFHDSHRTQIRVPAARLDEVARNRELREPIYLKVDTEGGDLPVLRSLDFDLSKPALVMSEFMDARSRLHFGYTHSDMVDHMAGLDYSAYISEWAELEGYSRRGVESAGASHLNVWQAPAVHNPAWGNLIFVPRGSEERFEDGLVAYLSEVMGEIEKQSREFVPLKKWAENARTTISNRERKIENLEASLVKTQVRVDELRSAIQQRDARAVRQLEAIDKLKGRLVKLQNPRSHRPGSRGHGDQERLIEAD